MECTELCIHFDKRTGIWLKMTVSFLQMTRIPSKKVTIYKRNLKTNFLTLILLLLLLLLNLKMNLLLCPNQFLVVSPPSFCAGNVSRTHIEFVSPFLSWQAGTLRLNSPVSGIIWTNLFFADRFPVPQFRGNYIQFSRPGWSGSKNRLKSYLQQTLSGSGFRVQFQRAAK